MKKLQFLDNVKVFIFDVGKTLFDKDCQTKCSEKTIKALNLLKRKGYEVGVCTMRTISHIKDIIDFDFDFFVLNNGSYLVYKNKVLIDEPLDIKISNKDFLTYTPFETFYSTNEAKDKANQNGFIADKKGKASKFYNLILFDADENEISKFKHHYSCYIRRKTKTISIQKAGCSRINAINELTKALSVSTEQLIYFGDGPNDLEVFRYLQNSIAMGNCYPELLKYALYQIDTCKNDGVAKFIFSNYLLKQ